MILCVEKLHDFCEWRGSVIFLTQSLRFHDLFSWRLHEFFFAESLPDFFGVIFLVESLHNFLCGEVARLFFGGQLE